MGYDFALNDQELARSFSLRDDKREEFFHSSGYADAQNSGKIGAASFGKTVAERQDLNENRRFVRGYENASLNSQIAITRERTRGMFERERTNAGGMGGEGAAGDLSGRQYGGGGAGQMPESNPRGASETGGYRYHDDLTRKQELMRGGAGREGASAGGNSNTTTNYRDYAAAAKQSFSQEQSRGGSNTGGRYGGSYDGYGEGGGDSSRSGGYGIGRPQGGSGYGGSSIAKSFKPDFGMKFGSGGK